MLWTRAIVVAFCCVFFSSVHGQQVLDQASLDDSQPMASVGESGATGATRGQSFTVGASGLLSSIDFALADRFGAPDNDPIIVRVVAGVQPSSAVPVASGLIEFASVPTTNPGWVSVDLTSSNLTVNAGQVFTIWLSSNAPGLNHATWYGNVTDSYSGGQGFASGSLIGNPDLDFAFRTYVGAAPPSQVLDQASFDASQPMASVGESGATGATRGQSFTAGAAGLLSRIDFALANRFGSPDDDPIVVRVVAGVQPSSAVPIAGGVIEFASVPTPNPGWVSVDLTSSNLTVNPGQVFTIWLSSNAPELNHATWYGNVNNPYSGGQGFAFGNLGGNPTLDFAFRTYIGAAPPSPVTFTSARPPDALDALNDTLNGVGYCIVGHPVYHANCADPDGSGLLQLGDGHQYSGNLTDVTFDADGNYYVAETGPYPHQIRKFGPDDRMVTRWTTGGDAWSVAFDSTGDAWVSTRRDGRIAKFDSAGQPLAGGINIGQRLSGIHIDDNDNIFIGLDGPAFGEVRKYDLAGNLLLTIYPINDPRVITTDSAGNIYVLAGLNCFCSTGTIIKYAANGSLLTYVNTAQNGNWTPNDIAVDALDQLWVTASQRRQLVVMDTDLNEIFTVGMPGTGLDEFEQPNVLAFNPRGNLLYVSDQGPIGMRFSVWGKPTPTPPLITPSVSGALGTNDWYVSNVFVSWTVDDPESPILVSAGCDPVTVGLDTNGQTLNCAAISEQGFAKAQVTVRRDTTPPTATPMITPAPNVNDWNNTDVTVAFQGFDTGSGIASCSSVLLSANGANQSASGSCTDLAGNAGALVTASGINIDRTRPTVTIATPANSSTFSLDAYVPAAYSCGGGPSAIQSCVGPVASGSPLDTSTAGVFSFAVTAVDEAGNTFTRTNTYTVTADGDTTAPQIASQLSGTLGQGGWYVSNVSLTWQVTDQESAVSSTSGCANRVVSNNTSGVTYTCSAVSSGGSATESVTIRRAATPPTVNVTAPVQGGTYYNGASVNARYTCSGPPSGIASDGCTGPVANNTPFDTSTIGPVEFTVTATTVAGLTTTRTVTYNVIADPSPPALTSSVTGTLGNNGWYRSNVTIRWTVADPESVISASSGCGNTTINSNTAGVSITCSATSAGGTSSESVTVARDATLPAVTITTPRNNFTYARNAVIVANYACSDADSGLAPGGCAGAVPAGTPIDTSTPGTFSFAVTGTDNAGNARTVTRTYTVP